MRLLVVSIIVCLFIVSCKESYLPMEDNVLVVEGWIDSEGYPVVMITTSAPVSDKNQSISSLDEYLLKWAKVTVDDGDKEVVLTGKADSRYTPPYIFTTSQMKGVIGKTYKLTVSYADFYAEAVTTIPSPVQVDSFIVTPIKGDSLVQLVACLKDSKMEKNFYKFFIKVKGYDEVFLPTFLGTINDDVIDEYTQIPVYQPSRMFFEEYTPYFTLHDTISVKISQMNEDAYEFWKAYDEIQSFSGVLFFPITKSLPSNIKGGIGYWFGYGSETYSFTLDSCSLHL